MTREQIIIYIYINKIIFLIFLYDYENKINILKNYLNYLKNKF